MAEKRTIYSLEAIRALALHTQRLTTASRAAPIATPETIYDLVDQLGAVQIDSLQVVQRSHYLTLWSRLGCYDTAAFDRLIYGDPAQPQDRNTRRLFEHWLHAACILPLTDYRYRLRHMRRMRETPANMTMLWLAQKGGTETLAYVLDRLRREGQLSIADFEYSGPQHSGWFDWKPVKTALEHLFACGELLIASRVNFQRVYDLRERVLPEWVDTREPTQEETWRYLLQRAVRALGICQASQAADSLHELKASWAKPIVEALIAEGVFVPVSATLSTGKTATLIVHRDNLSLLEQAADGAIVPRRTTFLNPFDNLFWPQGRDRQLWNFHHVLEAYKPEPKRTWGYFCLAILYRDRFIGRFDPVLDRQSGLLRLRALYLVPDVQPDEELMVELARAMRDFMAFHSATDLLIERSEPESFGTALAAFVKRET
jgi:uncharacterized protein YcaQ